MFVKKNIRNIGIFAHVDAGKTTLTENLLFESGSIAKLGRVDDGTAHTDSMSVERERGISVKAAGASIQWKETQINIIDTPGHVDFTAEVERSLMVLDGAVLVVSAVEGVQSQTEIIWSALQEMEIPTLIFINKADRVGANSSSILSQIRERMTNKALPIQVLFGEGKRELEVASYEEHCGEEYRQSAVAPLRKNLCEALAEWKDAFLEKLVRDEAIEVHEIESSLCELSREALVYPVLFGAALQRIGINQVLAAIVKYLPEPVIFGKEVPAGLAYKIDYNGKGDRRTHVRLYEGSVKVRDTIYNSTRQTEEKITAIFKACGSQFLPASTLQSGELGILCGLSSAKIGDVFGSMDCLKKHSRITSPTLTVQVYPQNPARLDALVEAVRCLEEEDPLLNVRWQEEERQLHLQLMGKVQMEIISTILKKRFKLDAVFEQPSVIYKEAPRGEGLGMVSMTSPYFAELKLQVEPLPKGSGVRFESLLSTDYIFAKFQREVEQTIPLALKEGNYGWEVTDIKVSLIGGISDSIATNPSDFRAITPIAVADAVKASGTVLLEPMLSFEVKVGREETGTIIKELIGMRAVLQDQVLEEDRFIIKGIIPMATSLDYPMKVAAFSKGRSVFKTSCAGYKECSLEQGLVRPRKAVDPSDRERYLQSISRKNQRDREAMKKRA